MNPNYPSASQAIRNLNDIRTTFTVVHGDEPAPGIRAFRVIRFEPPYISGSEFWVVNEKGFLWEPAESLDSAIAYLSTTEAREYLAAGSD